MEEKLGFKKIEDGIYEGKKTLAIENFEVKSEDDATYIYGYANTKGNEDAYGDIPFGDNVYDLNHRHKKNPVALVDHSNSVGAIFGVFVYGGEDGTKEDEKGLRIKLKLMENPQTEIARHAVEAYKKGYARAFSIGGRWIYGDKENPKHLTKAIIHEISGVAIGADGQALTTTPKPKSDETAKTKALEALESEIANYRVNQSDESIKKIRELKKGV